MRFAAISTICSLGRRLASQFFGQQRCKLGNIDYDRWLIASRKAITRPKLSIRMKIRRLPALPLALLAAITCSAIITTPASAVLIVDFQSGTVDPGGRATVDVMLSSNSGDQELFAYDLSYLLNPLMANTDTTMTFIDPLTSPDFDGQGSPDIEQFVLDSNYVFFGNSFNEKNRPTAIFQNHSGLNGIANTGVLAGDLATDNQFQDINVTVTGTPSLLTRLSFRHNLLNGVSPASVGGDTFEITLGRTFAGDPETFVFLDQGQESPVEFALGTRGIITVTAIPEPGTFAFLGIAALGMCPIRRRR